MRLVGRKLQNHLLGYKLHHDRARFHTLNELILYMYCWECEDAHLVEVNGEMNIQNAHMVMC